MPNCTADRIEFGCLRRRVIEANFDSSAVTSEGGLLQLRQLEERGVQTRATPAVCASRSPHTTRREKLSSDLLS